MNAWEKFGERKRSVTDDCIVSYLRRAKACFPIQDSSERMSAVVIQNVMKGAPIHVLLS